MIKDDLAPGLGTGISAVLAALSYLSNIGALQILLSVITGAFVTYWVQSRLQVRQEQRKLARENYEMMRDNVYGPLFKSANLLSQDLKAYKAPKIEKIRDIMNEHPYFTAQKDIRQSIESLYSYTKNYLLLNKAAQGAAETIEADVVFQNLVKKRSNSGLTLSYMLKIEEKFICNLDLRKAIIKDSTPRRILEEKAAGFKSFQMRQYVGGQEYPYPEEVDQACEIALERIRQNPTFIDKEALRKMIIQEAENTIEKLKKVI